MTKELEGFLDDDLSLLLVALASSDKNGAAQPRFEVAGVPGVDASPSAFLQLGHN